MNRTPHSPMLLVGAMALTTLGGLFAGCAPKAAQPVQPPPPVMQTPPGAQSGAARSVTPEQRDYAKKNGYAVPDAPSSGGK